eukprot:TRINITY_DN93764_c0_g1_i1.p1 TRINITY_DN93764_c0_g1~~TRINITY_DN93764_c0_g1_i1.p1  ORF type:complete len:184 (+),score=46.14 TRINITY_DN93764_c0_g1_i1:182-733(+)
MEVLTSSSSKTYELGSWLLLFWLKLIRVFKTTVPASSFSKVSLEMSAVEAKKKEWAACLAKSGGYPAKCEKFEKDLRSASKAAGIDSCVDETVALMRCTAGSNRTNGCSEQFLAMRECNRAGGKQLMAEGAGYAVAPSKLGLFTAEAGGLTQSRPPARSLEGMQEFGQEYAKKLGIQPGEVRF